MIPNKRNRGLYLKAREILKEENLKELARLNAEVIAAKAESMTAIKLHAQTESLIAHHQTNLNNAKKLKRDAWQIVQELDLIVQQKTEAVRQLAPPRA